MIQLQMLKSKIHRVTVTEANLDYIGSITIDEDLLDAAGILPGERVYIVDNNNGERFDTYTIAGDTPTIMAYATMSEEEARSFRPKVIFPDTATNRLITE